MLKRVTEKLQFWCFPDDGKVVKAVSVVKDNWDTEEIILEELTVFQVRPDFVLYTLNNERQSIYIYI